MQNEIKKNINLLNADGTLPLKAGRGSILKYDRSGDKGVRTETRNGTITRFFQKIRSSASLSLISDWAIRLSAYASWILKKSIPDRSIHEHLPLGKTGFPPDSESPGL
jgi:hypothetical protein